MRKVRVKGDVTKLQMILVMRVSDLRDACEQELPADNGNGLEYLMRRQKR